MITGVNFRPKFYAPAYNPVVWSVTSDRAGDTDYIDFKYVFDIYVDSVKVNRIKQRPNPANAGMLDVSLIVQSYLNVGAFANEVGVAISQPYKTGADAICSVYLIIGEEYATVADPTLRIYTGTANVEGEPNYRVGAQGYQNAQTQPTQSSPGSEYVPVIALPYTMDWAEQQQTLAAQNGGVGTDYFGLFGDASQFVLKNPGLFTQSTVGGVGKFLSSYPRTNEATGDWQTTGASPSLNISVGDYVYDRYTLSFLNRNPVYQYYYSGGQYPYLQASSPLVAYFNFYNSAEENIGHVAMPNYQTVLVDSVSVPYGGNPRAACGSQLSVFSNSDNTELISLRVGPKDLEDMNVFAGLAEMPAYYTVQLFANLTIDASCNYTGSPSVPLSELVTITLEEDCTSYLYPRVRLAWLNGMGGRDYWNFTMFAEQEISSTAKEWYQSEVLWSNTTPVVIAGDKTQNWLHGGDKQYNKVITNSWKITTNWLTQEEVSFLKEASQASQLWAYIGEVDFPYTCKIKETNYTVKTIKQVKVYTVTFTIETAVDRSMQIV